MDVFNVDNWRKYDINEDALVDYLNFIKLSVDSHGGKPFKYDNAHHVIPKCIDEDLISDPYNIVYISGREHFIAHKMLIDVFNGINKRDIAYAYACMSANSRFHNVCGVTPEEYEEAWNIYRDSVTGENNPCYNSKTYNNGICEMRIKEGEEAPEGFIEGRLHGPCEGMIQYTNGTINKYYPEEIEPPEGFYPGRLYRTIKEGARLYNNGTDQGYYIPGEEPDGWELGANEEFIQSCSERFSGEGNPCYETTRCNNGVIEICIPIGSDPPEGFVLGRLPSFGENHSKKMTNHKVYTDGVNEVIVFEGEEPPEGYYNGLSDSHREIMSRQRKDAVVYTDGTKTIRLKPGIDPPDGFYLGSSTNKNCKIYNNGIEQHYYIPGTEPDGYVEGGLPRGKINRKDTRRYKVYNNGKEQIRVYEDEEVPDGFIKGELNKRKITKKAKSGYRIYNNGIEEIKVFPGDIVPEGFVKGRKTKKKPFKFYNNGVISIHVIDGDPIPEGFIYRGRLPLKKSR